MAGDWIKMRSNLRSHPKVVRIASALKADRLRIVGGLHAVWCLFDEHSEDGRLCGYTPAALDDEIGFPGFSDLMVSNGWLSWDGKDGLELPEFDTHNGASAKRRAQEADRKRAERAASKEGEEDDRTPSAPDADKKRTREEKRREEKKDIEALPEWVPSDAWDGYIQARKQMRKPMTDRAKKLLLGELTKLREQGHDPANLLDTATAKNWLSVYPPKGEGNRTRSGVAL